MASTQAPAWGTPLFIAGTGLSSFLSGAIFSISALTVPSLLTNNSNAAILTTWANIFKLGASLAAPLGLAGSTVHLLNAYSHKQSANRSVSDRAMYFVIAGISTAAIVPFTLIFMNPTNQELLRREAAARGTQALVDSDTVALVKKWGAMNMFRSVLPAIGALAAFLSL